MKVEKYINTNRRITTMQKQYFLSLLFLGLLLVPSVLASVSLGNTPSSSNSIILNTPVASVNLTGPQGPTGATGPQGPAGTPVNYSLVNQTIDQRTALNFTQEINDNSTQAGQINICLANNATFVNYVLKTGDFMTGNLNITNVGNITNVNRLGVGPGNPSADLQIGFADNANKELRILSGVNSLNRTSKLGLYDTSTSWGYTLQDNGDTAQFEILRHNNDATGVKAFVLDRATGNIGIGLNTPKVKLDVNGSVQIGNRTTSTIYPLDIYKGNGNSQIQVETGTAGTADTIFKNSLDTWEFGLNAYGVNGFNIADSLVNGIHMSIQNDTIALGGVITGVKGQGSNMFIDGNGRVGIKTIIPMSTFVVNGSANISDSLIVNGVNITQTINSNNNTINTSLATITSNNNTINTSLATKINKIGDNVTGNLNISGEIIVNNETVNGTLMVNNSLYVGGNRSIQSGYSTYIKGNVLLGNNLDFANPGINTASVINFLKLNDQASIQVNEYSSDNTRYTFLMADNPDSTQDQFIWQINDWQGSGSAWQPLLFNGITSTIRASNIKTFGNIILDGPYYSGINGQEWNYSTSETGTQSFSINAENFTSATYPNMGSPEASVPVYIRINSTGDPQKFDWWFGNSGGPAMGSAVTIDNTTDQLLNFSIYIRWTANTGGNVGDLWNFRVSTGGHIYTQNGSSSRPAYSFIANNESGMYATNHGGIAFTTNKTTRMTIDDSGNITLGANNISGNQFTAKNFTGGYRSVDNSEGFTGTCTLGLITQEVYKNGLLISCS